MMHDFWGIALALPGALLLFCCVAGALVANPIRRLLRPIVLRRVYEQIEGVAQLQTKLRNPLLDVLTKITALTVSVEFYLISIPPLVWLGGPRGPLAGMALCQCMAVSTYMTCVLKDILSCPRPTQLPASLSSPTSPRPCDPTDSTPQARLMGELQQPLKPDAPQQLRARFRVEARGSMQPDSLPPPAAGLADQRTEPSPPAISCLNKPDGPGASAGLEVIGEAYRGEIEMGAPSMHTWCALILPAYAAVLAQQLGVLSAARVPTVIAGAACWACWVGLSRLYLGVHTPVDLLLGALGGAAMLGLWSLIGATQLAAVAPAVAVEAVRAMGFVPAWAKGVAAAAVEAADGAGAGVGSGLPALAVVALLYVLALATYPRPLSHTTSYDYSAIFLGAALGGLVSTNDSMSLLPRLFHCMRRGPHSPRAVRALLHVPAALRHPVGVVLVGFLLVALVKEVSKALLSALLPLLLDLAPPGLRMLWQPPVHPSGCWRPRVEVVAAADADGVANEATGGCVGMGRPKDLSDNAGVDGDVGKGAGGGGRTDRGPRRGVLMKTQRLAYDVDFLRKFLNYGLTVYAVVEYRHVAALLLDPSYTSGSWRTP